MLELLFVIGFFVMLMVTLRFVAGHYRCAGCGDGHYVPRRYAGIDD